MRCPFPGMDPYLEQPEIWPDFHDSLIAAIRGVLQPLLRPRYAALTQDRLFVVESDRPIRPDVSVIETGSDRGGTAVATVAADAPAAVYDLECEEFRQPLIHIIEPAAGNRLVTAIEVLSPDNKRPGAGRQSYLRKRDEYWQGGANLVEIDLLRGGDSTVRVPVEWLEPLKPFSYLAVITRVWPRRQELYSIGLRQRLPRLPIPLAEDDRDVTLDLQAAFTRCWDEGPYPELLHYDAEPPGEMCDEDVGWSRQIVRRDNTSAGPESGRK
ncbi:MAG: DUF4058 family protein [Planctomycetales bacterium]|nr:DUF4058 family protein [Planctomycetales bacterium]